MLQCVQSPSQPRAKLLVLLMLHAVRSMHTARHTCMASWALTNEGCCVMVSATACLVLPAGGREGTDLPGTGHACPGI